MGIIKDRLYADYRQNARDNKISFSHFWLKALLGRRESMTYSWIFWFRISSHSNRLIAHFAR